MVRFARVVAALALLGAGVMMSAQLPGRAVAPLTFGAAVKLTNADGDTEPRFTVAPDDRRYIATNRGGTAVVFASTDSATWTQVTGTPASQTVPTIDVDIVSTRTGRLLVTELDTAGLNFRTSFSDDRGATWTAVSGPAGPPPPDTGTGVLDTDRPWLTVGPDDPTSGQPTVYLLFHNLASGAGNHNMYVATSTDNGTNFGAPVPVTAPGTQAFLDLQCADSGGPSNIFTNPRTGRVYAVFGTRSSVAAGGCGASITGSFEVNVVAATRIWIASAPASGAANPASWTQSLAVDDNTSGKIVGMQLAPAAIDSADNVYVAYPESVNPYPDYSGAAIKMVHATESGVAANPYGLLGPTTNPWSAAATIAPAGGAGHLLPHLVAGGPGQVDFAYFTGLGAGPNWYATAAQTLNGLDPNPSVSEVQLSATPTYSAKTASIMMGACGSGPSAGVQNGFLCNRSTDVWGVALDHAGNFQVTWPGDGPTSGTYAVAQTGGPTLTAGSAPVVPESPIVPGLLMVAAAAALVAARRPLSRLHPARLTTPKP